MSNYSYAHKHKNAGNPRLTMSNMNQTIAIHSPTVRILATIGVALKIIPFVGAYTISCKFINFISRAFWICCYFGSHICLFNSPWMEQWVWRLRMIDKLYGVVASTALGVILVEQYQWISMISLASPFELLVFSIDCRKPNNNNNKYIIIIKNNKSRMCSGVVMTWDVFFWFRIYHKQLVLSHPLLR